MQRLLILFLFTVGTASADNGSAESVASELWRGLSHGPNEATDVETLRTLFHPDAVVFGARYTDKHATLNKVEASSFLSGLETIRDYGFYECEVYRHVQVYDRFATIYSVVESRTDKDAKKPDFTGVNSIQLFRLGTQWKILSLYYQVESPFESISLNQGESGKCLTQ
ncbi:nuclear transport factor 2 family protein [Lacimicrobium sp. SS2-24]|uniref:nuclear transport factor 2 family protein n=1 Tax=Lacimicrobium sp. SS2-24 TaxID=2005569 RepID=UPI000B4B5AEA|nr:nuclear transport factor 2 family protein [Lacimicrobium sp. SS2-24]